MQYISTRGKQKPLNFKQTVLGGLASDGGLIVPTSFPNLQNRLSELKDLSFQDLSYQIMLPFVDGEIENTDLQNLINKSFSTFRTPEITPIIPIGDLHILELFHGPTYAFKDIALQFLGNLFEHFLKQSNQTLCVIGATSGDTGSAAIYGLKGKDNVKVFMLHPLGRVSKIQEMQMTSVMDTNIHNIAIRGSFDDAQNIVKTLFCDLDFKKEQNLGAVNSINFARILSQIVYYFASYFKICDGSQEVNFSVPTGNFGDVLAGYYAYLMGLPINKLIVATNQNDILHRFFSTGKYHSAPVKPSYSPSMDIQISSNFERFLYHLAGNDSDQLNSWMDGFNSTSKLTIEGGLLAKAGDIMTSQSVSEEETLKTIKETYQKYNYLLDPHTAVGVAAAYKANLKGKTISLATADSCKFLDVIESAIGKRPDLPDALKDLHKSEFRLIKSDADLEQIKDIVLKN